MHCRLLMLRSGTVTLEFYMGGVVFCLCCSCALICTVALFFLFHALFATVHSKMIPNTINATLLIFFETFSRLTCPSTPHTGCSSYPRTMNTKFRHRFASRSMETKAHEAPNLASHRISVHVDDTSASRMPFCQVHCSNFPNLS
jgi:hypothetical protein